jgi:hypothetical protein
MINYKTVLVIVIVELVFAFSIGLMCIIFSINLFRAIKESESVEDLDGNGKQKLEDLSHSPNSCSYGSVSSSEYYDITPTEDVIIYIDEDEPEMDLERKLNETGNYSTGMGSVLMSLGPYLRLW